jgi:hypothetical protein
MPRKPSAAVLNARYVAIRAAEAKGLADQLLAAARDRTPGVRRLLMPMLYRFWYREREAGWKMLVTIGEDIIRFPGVPDAFATETFAEFSLAVLNGCRGDRQELDRLASIWRVQMERVLSTPLARILGRGRTLRLLARPVAGVLRRQPVYQPLNFQELSVTFARPDSFRRAWHAGLACLEHPDQGVGAIAEILSQKDLSFDVYLMLLGERALTYHGVKVDPSATFALLEQLFRDGCPWFQQSVIYILFHMLHRAPSVDDKDLDRYAAIAEDFFISNGWRMRTSVAEYNFASHLRWPEIVIEQHRPGAAPRVLPRLMERAVAAGNADEIEGLFTAIDSIAFAHGHAPLALKLLDQSAEIGGAKVEERVLKSLSTVRLQDQALVDAFLEEHRNLTRLRSQVGGVEPTVREEDMPTLLDGLTAELIVTSDYFRQRVCDAFRRAAGARTVAEFLVQILDWIRDEFSHLAPHEVEPSSEHEIRSH